MFAPALKQESPPWRVRAMALAVVLALHGGLILIAMSVQRVTVFESERVVRVVQVPEEPPPETRPVELQLRAPSPPIVEAPEFSIDTQSESPTDAPSLIPAASISAAESGGGSRGGDIGQGSGASAFTTCTHRVMPDYPADAKLKGESGKVLLVLLLDDRGRFTKVSIARSSGSRSLDLAGIEAIKRWRCSPVIENGRAVSAFTKQEFEFTLR